MRVPFSVLYLVVSLVVHGSAARWLLARTPWLREAPRKPVFLAAVVVVAVLPGFAKGLLSRVYTGLLVRLLAASVLELFAMTLTVLLVTVATLLARTGRHAVEVVAPAKEPVEPAVAASSTPVVDRRQALERLAGVGLYGVTTGTFGYGAVRGRNDFALEEVVVKVPGWPRALDGYVVAQVSDVHVGAFMGENGLRRGFELVRRARPDLVVATGDLVDTHAEAVELLAAQLRDVPARDGAFAIVGNHDHYAGPEEVTERLVRAGVRVLNNEGIVLRGGDGGGFALLGVDDLRGRQVPRPGFAGPDLGRAIASVPAHLPRVLLAHQPNYFREAAGRVALQLSGHTHGGQITPLTSPVTAFWEFVRGRYERQGSTLWVNRGFGTSGPPSRVGSPPEITRIVLVSA